MPAGKLLHILMCHTVSPWVIASRGNPSQFDGKPPLERFLPRSNTYPPLSQVVIGIIPTPPSDRLRTRKGRLFRKSENSLMEIAYIVHRFSKPGDVLLDDGSGTGVIIMAGLQQNREVICVEKDYDCAIAAEIRGKAFLKCQAYARKREMTISLQKSWRLLLVELSPIPITGVNGFNGPQGFRMDIEGLDTICGHLDLIVSVGDTRLVRKWPALKGIGRGLFTQKSYNYGDTITPAYGKYLDRKGIEESKSDAILQSGHKDGLGLDMAFSCPARYANDACHGKAADCQDIVPNVFFRENAGVNMRHFNRFTLVAAGSITVSICSHVIAFCYCFLYIFVTLIHSYLSIYLRIGFSGCSCTSLG